MTKRRINIPVNVDNCFLEEFRILRTRLELICEGKKSLVVTSVLPREGKTTVAINLSRSLADIGKRVLFIDCDLRNSEIAAAYEIEDTAVGIESYLVGQKNMEEIILKSNKENLDFVLAVGSSINSTELLDGERFRALLKEVKEEYDFVIIDTPSMAECADATIIAKEADAVILVIQENRVCRRMIEESLERLREAKSEVLGVVLNKSENQILRLNVGR